MKLRHLASAALAIGLVAALAACSDSKDSGDSGNVKLAEHVLNVPEDYDTIQAAVDAAVPGDLVLIDEGTYNEQVTVETEDIVIRGVDRNKVILDGEYTLDNGIRIVGAGGVAVENMTAINYRFNGFFWTGVDGYRGSYLTAVRNGDYGIYAFDSVNGLLEHSYGGGSPDAGFYIGQCNPCNAVVDDVLSENNGLGYSGTNSSGNLVIMRSTFRYNRAGIVPNSGSGEKLAPQADNIIVGNLVYSNNNPDTPAIDAAKLAMGNGILIAGGNDNLVIRNLVWDHDVLGIGAVLNSDDKVYPVSGNSFKDNVVSDSRVADLGLVADPDGRNCFSGNTFTTSGPKAIETAAPCDGTATTSFTDGALPFGELIVAKHPDSADRKLIKDPPAQPTMPDPLTTPARPANNMPGSDRNSQTLIDSIALPKKP